MSVEEPKRYPGDLVCSCCGRGIPDTANDNAWHDEVPYPGDAGTGLCRACGGDPDAKDVRARLGWCVTCFVDARIPILAMKLSARNRERLLAMEYEDQVRVVLQMVARGLLA